MSKMFEALDRVRGQAAWAAAAGEAAASGPAAAHAEAPAAGILSEVNLEKEMVRLHQHLEALLRDDAHR
jgi:hypothetical protein